MISGMVLRFEQKELEATMILVSVFDSSVIP